MSQYGEFGGGYMTGGSPFGSQASPGGTTKKPPSHSLRPVTIKQALQASQLHTDSELYIDDIEVAHITIVAQVISVQSQATNVVYWVDDSTGRIEARWWSDAGNAVDGDDEIKEGIYVRITGGLKNFNNKRYINASHVRPVKDPHEIYFHIYESMYVTLCYQRGPPNAPGSTSTATTSAATTDNALSSYQSNGNGGSVASTSIYAHLPPLERQIVEFILSSPPTQNGVHVANIARKVQTDAQKISEALDYLMDEGIVFSTIDESHFNVAT